MTRIASLAALRSSPSAAHTGTLSDSIDSFRENPRALAIAGTVAGILMGVSGHIFYADYKAVQESRANVDDDDRRREFASSPAGKKRRANERFHEWRERQAGKESHPDYKKAQETNIARERAVFKAKLAAFKAAHPEA